MDETRSVLDSIKAEELKEGIVSGTPEVKGNRPYELRWNPNLLEVGWGHGVSDVSES